MGWYLSPDPGQSCSACKVMTHAPSAGPRQHGINHHMLCCTIHGLNSDTLLSRTPRYIILSWTLSSSKSINRHVTANALALMSTPVFHSPLPFAHLPRLFSPLTAISLLPLAVTGKATPGLSLAITIQQHCLCFWKLLLIINSK